MYICIPVSITGFVWEHSSVGSERLPYKQRVGGSTPSAPTKKDDGFSVIIFFYLATRCFFICIAIFLGNGRCIFCDIFYVITTEALKDKLLPFREFFYVIFGVIDGLDHLAGPVVYSGSVLDGGGLNCFRI